MNRAQSFPSIGANAMRIVFMGTPGFAVPSLNALLEAGYNIVGVITAPDKPAGRGMKVTESEVKKYASEKGLKIMQPVRLKDNAFVEELRSLQADLQVVVAFRMLPEIVWSMPPMGTINVHGSLLPQYRGAAPINWAVINGEKQTGVTTFKLQREIDTGNILLQQKMDIGENETAGEVHDRMKEIGATLLVDTIRGLVEGTLIGVAQQELPAASADQQQTDGALRHAPKIFRDTCRIDWNNGVDEINNLIRGLSPFPGAFTMLGDKMLKIFKGRKIVHPHTGLPGSYESDGKQLFRFLAGDGYIEVLELQLEGKKRMQVEDFLRGNRI